MRSKLLGWPTSIAFDNVASDGRGSNRPVSRYAGTTSFALVAATNRAIGSPARFAIRPAVRLPKLPLGVENTTRPPPPPPPPLTTPPTLTTLPTPPHPTPAGEEENHRA